MVVRTVTGQYLNSDGVTPVRGYLEFTPSSTLVDNASSAVIPVSVVRAVLDTTGSFSVDLQVTDEAGFEPVGWLWSVEEKIPGGQQWYLAVPTGGTPLDIADVYDPDLTPAPILPGTHIHTYALDDLTDVDLTGATTGQVLTRAANGTWGPVTPSVGGPGTGNLSLGIPLEDFAGADHDAKLATAITTISAMSTKVPILLSAGVQYTFNNALPTVYHGFALIGVAATGGNPEQSSKNTSFVKVKINYAGTWFNATTSLWGIKFWNLDITGTTSTVFANSSGVAAWCWHWHNVSFNQFKSVFGTKTASAWCDAILFDGWWNVANTTEGAFYLGGSDNHLWLDGMLIDSPEAYAVTPGQYLISLKGFQKNSIGPIYMTVQNNWRGIYVDDLSAATGGQSNAVMFQPGGVVEGRNDGLSGEGNVGAMGCLVRIRGAAVAFTNWIFNHAMYSPSAMGGTDMGVIWVSDGGDLSIIQASYARQNLTAESVPFIYASDAGTTVSALHIRGCKSGPEAALAWTGKPRYQVASGAVIDVDASMQSNTGVVATRFLDWTGTQAQYDAISPKDANTSYYIVG